MPPHFTILGGGISGLSLAFFLRQRIHSTIASTTNLLPSPKVRQQIKDLLNARITIIEGQERVGGWINTNDEHGHVFERGPRGFRPSGNGVEILRLAEDLGLANSAVKTSSASKHRFLFVEGKLQQMPAGLSDLLQLPSVLRGAIKGVMNEPFQSKGLWSDETIHSFITRRFGEHVANNIVGGMVSGIYGGDIKKLSIKSCFPKLWNIENEHGSILKGMLDPRIKILPNLDPFEGAIPTDSDFVHEYSKAAQVSFVHGLEQLTATLEEQLLIEGSNVEIIRGDPATRLDIVNDNISRRSDQEGERREDEEDNDDGEFSGMKVALKSGHVLETDRVFSTLPSEALSQILCDSASKTALNILDEMETCDIGLINMAFDDPELIKRPAFGYLIPASEGEKVLGVSFDSCIFPDQITSATASQHNKNVNDKKRSTVVCVMVGGVNAPDVKEMSNAELLEEAKRAVTKHLNLKRTEVDHKLTKHIAGVVKGAIPQYRVGHSASVQKLELLLKKEIPGLTILGTSFYGVGLADAVSRAKKVSVCCM